MIFPRMRTKGNATPIIPMPFLKSRYDWTRGGSPDVVTIPFLRFLGRSERFSSQTLCYFCLSMDMHWQIDVLVPTFSFMNWLTGAVTLVFALWTGWSCLL